MTDEEKIIQLRAITDPSVADDLLPIYLSIAKDKVLQRCYPFLTDYSSASVPTKYETLQVEVANELLLKRGAEGETSHNENGVNRTYENADASESLLNKIVPFGKVFN